MIKTKEDREKRKKMLSKDKNKDTPNIELKDNEATSGSYKDNFNVAHEITECDVAAGDYLDSDKACAVCCARMLCLLNAIKLGNVTRDSLSPELLRMIDAANTSDPNTLINKEGAAVMAIPVEDKPKKKKKHKVGKLR
jgi:hypothetical protein